MVAHLVARLNTHPIVLTGFGRVTGDELVGLLDRVVFATVQNVPALPAASPNWLPATTPNSRHS